MGDNWAMREATFIREAMDPLVRAMLDTDEPWQAYEAVVGMRAAMTDYLLWGPHGGRVFVAWASLEDLYETGMTPVADAYAALRAAAAAWLARPEPEALAEHLDRWLAETTRTVAAIAERDGDFWSPPSAGPAR